jgi:predicted metalloprotease with PDZ domain
MTYYTLSRDPERGRHILVRIRFETLGAVNLTLELPNWRPGRYELANFARNVVGFSAQDTAGEPLVYHKSSRLVWTVETRGATEIEVVYSYYANQPDGGACWVDADLFYVNPVNCLMYTADSRHKNCSLILELRANEKIATGLTRSDAGFLAQDFDELVDSPLLCSEHMQHHAFQVDHTAYHIWFYGLTDIPWEKLIKDFIAFTKVQHQCMGALPVKEFHYLNLILPFKFYHGVEHRNSTVIALGPAEEVFGKQYSELLGVSSHELFHTWNVKYIKPQIFAPYDYSKENYSPLGYVYEGFTTYYGDLFLHKAGVFDWPAYAKEVNAYLKRHFDNYGRYNHSLHESSVDTWVDGYGAPAAPNRRVSIYAEGMLNALILDLSIRQHTDSTHSLDALMRALYADAQAGKSYDEAVILAHLKAITGEDYSYSFEKHYHKPISLELELNRALSFVGCCLVARINPDPIAAWLGVVGTDSDGWRTITAIAPGSVAALAGLMVEDKLALENHISKADWKEGQPTELVWVNRLQLVQKSKVLHNDTTYFNSFVLERCREISPEQKAAFDRWTQ